MQETDFAPFYERWIEKYQLGAMGKIMIALVPGLLFFLSYYSIVGTEALRDWTWLLALLISCALLFLFYATATLRNLFPIWTAHIEGDQAELYLEPLNRYLCDRNFIMAALFFGGLNVAMGVLFGVATSNPAAAAILFIGYFLAGFTCGLPAMGILGVVATFRKFTKTTELKLDYTSPDRCGGLSFMGSALVKFSVVTLVEGILIASYILLADWTRADNAWVQLIMWAWIVFPFLLSMLVLVLPAIDLNRMLSRYRLQLEQALKRKCTALRDRIEALETASEEREVIRSEYEYHCTRRNEVHSMRTWPFSVGATTSFVGAFVSNVVLAIELAKSFL